MNRRKRIVHLDTHVVCWLFAGMVHQLSSTARTFIEENDVAISPWVLSEVQMLHERGALNTNSEEIFSDLERRIGLQIASGQALAIVKSSYALSWATDPFDRMIAAHARLNESPLITKDAHLHTHFHQVIW